MNAFFRGVRYVFRGVRAYYSDKTLWKYGLSPFLLLFLLYFSAFFACFHFLNSWKFWIVFLMLLFLVPLTLSLFYETAGGVFFDYLLAEYARKNHLPGPPEGGGKFWTFLLDTVKFNLISLVLTLVLLFLPVAGQLLFLLLVGIRNGETWLLPALYFYGRTHEEMKKPLRQKWMLTCGFGVTLTLLLSIPFAGLFLLPSLTIGGLLLVAENFLPGKEE